MQEDYVVGIDLGGTRVRAGLVAPNGEITARAEDYTQSQKGIEAVLDQIHALYETVSAKCGDRELIRAAGIGAPGPINTVTGVSLNENTISGYNFYPLSAKLQERLQKPVIVENDAIAATIGEWYYGAAKGTQNYIYVTIGTGIGGGAIINGQPMRGTAGLGGHFGHMIVEPDGPLCFCGNKGCWEAVASGSALKLMAESNGYEGAAELVRASNSKDKKARQLIVTYADKLGTGIVSLLHIFNPEMVVIGGGVSKSFDDLIPFIYNRIQNSAMPPYRSCPIVGARQTEDSGILGSAKLAFDHVQPSAKCAAAEPVS